MDKKASPKQQIIQVCTRLNQKNMLAATDGNVSIKISDNEILITPTGVNKAFISESDIAVITMDNKVVSGKPSGDAHMHLLVYKMCPSARAVIHAHPPTAIGWSVARPEIKELPNHCLAEIILSVGSIPFVPYARPTTHGMSEALRAHLPDHRVMIMSRHGALSWGDDIFEAYNGMERIEHSAMTLKAAQEISSLTELPEAEVQVLKEMRLKMGKQSL